MIVTNKCCFFYALVAFTFVAVSPLMAGGAIEYQRPTKVEDAVDVLRILEDEYSVREATPEEEANFYWYDPSVDQIRIDGHLAIHWITREYRFSEDGGLASTIVRNSDGDVLTPSRERYISTYIDSRLVYQDEYNFFDRWVSVESNRVFFEFYSDGRISRTFEVEQGKEVQQTITFYDGIRREIPADNIMWLSTPDDGGWEQEWYWTETIRTIAVYSADGSLSYLTHQYPDIRGTSLYPTTIQQYRAEQRTDQINYGNDGLPSLHLVLLHNGTTRVTFRYVYSYDHRGNWTELRVYKNFSGIDQSDIASEELIAYHNRQITYRSGDNLTE